MGNNELGVLGSAGGRRYSERGRVHRSTTLQAVLQGASPQELGRALQTEAAVGKGRVPVTILDLGLEEKAARMAPSPPSSSSSSSSCSHAHRHFCHCSMERRLKVFWISQQGPALTAPVPQGSLFLSLSSINAQCLRAILSQRSTRRVRGHFLADLAWPIQAHFYLQAPHVCVSLLGHTLPFLGSSENPQATGHVFLGSTTLTTIPSWPRCLGRFVAFLGTAHS